MLLIVTVPLTMLVLNCFSIGVFQWFYLYLRRSYPAWQLGRVGGVHLFWQTIAYQAACLPLFFVVSLLTSSGMAQNERALHLLLSSAFFIPPILLWKNRHRTAQN